MCGQARPPWIVPIFLPHVGCPHRCVFCDQRLITGEADPPSPDQVRARLEAFFSVRKRERSRGRQIAFYGGNFAGMQRGRQEAYLGVAREFLNRGWADSVRISTRPDEISPESLAFLAGHGVRTVEIGVQSLSDLVLLHSRRGHTAGQAAESIRAVRGSGLEAGAQIMVGLPGDSGEESLSTVEALCRLRPDFVRIYPVLVIRGTELANRMAEGGYEPLGLESAVSLCSRMLERFEAESLPVIRIGLLGEGQVLATGGRVLGGPYHAAFGFLVRSELFGRKAVRRAAGLELAGRAAHLRVHPFDRPLAAGHRGHTLEEIRRKVGADSVRVEEDRTIRRGGVEWSSG